MYQCADFLSVKESLKGPRNVDVENYDRHIPIIAEGIRRLVENPKLLCHRLGEGDLLVFHSRGIFFRVGGVDAVNFRAFKHDISTDLKSSERGAGVCGEKWIAQLR